MSGNSLLAMQLHYPVKQIRDLRGMDEGFDGICRDYVALFEEMSGQLDKDDQASLRYIADARESISALTNEIEARLQSFCPTSNHQTSVSKGRETK